MGAVLNSILFQSLAVFSHPLLLSRLFPVTLGTPPHGSQETLRRDLLTRLLYWVPRCKNAIITVASERVVNAGEGVSVYNDVLVIHSGPLYLPRGLKKQYIFDLRDLKKY